MHLSYVVFQECKVYKCSFASVLAMGVGFTILQLVYFMLPGYLANMSPTFARKLFPTLSEPVDFNAKLDGLPVLGPNKTWRGLIGGVIVGVLVAGVQALLVPVTGALNLYDYSQWHLLGGLLGFGAVFGDIVESFFKRRLRIASGKPWVPFDQIDHPIGSLALAGIIYFPGWTSAAMIVLITFVGHILFNVIGYWLKLKEVPW